jgi:hypothetical protein
MGLAHVTSRDIIPGMIPTQQHTLSEVIPHHVTSREYSDCFQLAGLGACGVNMNLNI